MFKELLSKHKNLDIRDEAIMEILNLLISHAHIILKDWEENGFDRGAVMLATTPLIKLGELKSLTEYLESSDIEAAKGVGKALMSISKMFKENFKEKENNGK